ncbi:hypothetical protein GWN42_09345, partial [candidate division KSB1 bacterium]|nr:hypothetical protein [candidate division KSB1 bacterium]
MKETLFRLWLAACLILPNLLSAQEASLPDSSLFQALSDTTHSQETNLQNPFRNQPATVTNDTTFTQTIKPVSVGLDSPVVYSAQTFDSNEQERIIQLIGDATVKYKNFTITAGKITVHWDENKLIAEGLPDTTNDRVATDGDTLETSYIGLPVFSDGREEMVGDKMEFNFKSEKGRIVRGRTEVQGGYYRGLAAKRVDKSVFFVSDGLYTTCGKDEPHFHFAGKKMKVILDDKVLAKPIVFMIGKIPVAVLPFGMFSLKEDGRQSGLILPQFGTSPTEGRYLQNLGYYWAVNDYFDTRFTLDFFEKTGILFRTHMNYALRYNFRGSVSGSFTRKNFPSGLQERRWDFRIRHSHIIDDNTNFSVNASFVSNNSFFKEFSTDRDERLNRQLISNATFSKRWAEGKNSITVNLSQTKDLATGSESRTLPQIRFTRNRSALFPFDEDKRGRDERKWYNYIQYDYKGFFENRSRRASSDDPNADETRSATHDVSLTYTNPQKLFGWLSWSQNISYDEDWFDRTRSFSVDTSGTIIESEEKGFAARHLFRYSTSASTNLFGTFFPKIGPIKAFRHRMSPSISFTYQPDYTSSFWGYFETVRDSLGNPLTDSEGNEIKRDRFGGTPSVEQNSLGVRLSNLFQMKLGEGENEKRIDLFNLDFSTGYNFAADSLKIRDLRTSFRANPRRNLGITMNMSHSFYKFDRDLNRTVDTFLLSENGFFNSLRLRNLQFDLRWSLRGRRESQQGDQAGAQTSPIEQIGQTESPLVPDDEDGRFGSETSFSALDIPWSASVSFSYSLNKFNPNNPTRNAYLNLSNVEVQLTKNWRIGYRMR